MLTFDVKRKINTLRDILVGKVPDPKAQVEQITIALIYKFMDDMDIEGLEFGGTRQFFTGEYENYAWTEIMKPENSGQQRALLYAEGIEKMTTNPNLPQLFRDIFRGAYIPYRDPDTLNMFLKEVSDFSYDNSEDLGNAFEYLLSIMVNEVDVIQVGARNMQNFEMLSELGHCDKPILLKRGLSSTMEELLMSAEYIVSGGNPNVILCERGIRTFETATRNTLDISAIPLLKQKSHLPVIVDPSHASGIASLVPILAKTAVVAGADGLMVEVHPNPPAALCDGAQSITPDIFDSVMESVRTLCKLEGKKL